ncbi:MAG TPA: hypothetical protein VFE52_06965, partial [Devosia sp.]|nr:hypothetical protein [Devosia sp.]
MLALLGPLGALLGLEAASIKNRIKRLAVLWSIVGLLGVIALVFALVAANNALVMAVGPMLGPLIIAGTALLVALITFGIFHFRDTVEARREAEKKKSAEVTAL